jgi:hypothetical protein
MNQVFVDTAAFIALGNRRDNLHQVANEVRLDLVKKNYCFLTTNLVLVELCNAFSAPLLRNIALQQIDIISHSKSWQLIDINYVLFQESLDLYRKMTDKSWGLVDCSSMVVSRKFKITTVFTSDHHFTQAGFNILLN